MKKNTFILLALAPLLASCQREMTEVGLFPKIIAEIESPSGTRTQLSVDESGVGTIYWKPADQIDVFFGTTRAVYSSQNNENATTATFQTSDSVSGTDISSTNIWGLYPSDDSSTCDGNSVTTTLPSLQYGTPDSFDDDLFITLAHSNSTTLQFYNVCGGIKFNLSRDDIKSITLKGNNNEDLAGKVKLSFSDGLPKSTAVNGVKEITLRPKSGQSFSKGVNYYFVTLPVTLSTGFTMTFTTTDESVGTLNYTGNSVTLKRSIFSRQNHIDLFASFEGNSQPNNVIYYTSNDDKVVTPNEMDVFGASIVSNEYVNGQGIIVFDADVTSIGDYAFSNCISLTAMTFPASVTSIGKGAFNYCSSLAYINLPNSVTRIGSYAFCGCNLSSIEIPSSVASIGMAPFYGCSQMKSIIVDSSNPIYDSRNDCNAIIKTNSNELIAGCMNSIIPNSVTSIGDYAFGDCKNLVFIEIPNSVSIIKRGAFFFCENLLSIELPNSVTSIGDYAFGGCSSLTFVEIPEGVKMLPDGCFRSCTSLKSIHLPQSLESIMDCSFYGCSSLVTITIPSQVSDLYYCAFYNCCRLESVFIESDSIIVFKNSEIEREYSVEDGKFGVFDKTNNCPIYVLVTLVDTYKASKDWIDYADRIQGFSPITLPPSNEIWYESYSGNTIPLAQSSSYLVSNTYSNGKGVYKFSRDLSTVDKMFDYSEICYTTKENEDFKSLILPPSITSIPSFGIAHLNYATKLVLPYNLSSLGSDSFCRFGEQTPEASSIFFIGEKAPSFVSTSIWNLHDLVSGGNKVDNLYYPENNSSYNSLLNIEVQGSAKHYWIPTKYIIHFSE